jgi:outer membrane usher protein
MAGVSADVGLRRAGVLKLGTAMGGNGGGHGGAALFGYSYFDRRFSANLHVRRFSDSFVNLSRTQQAAPIEFDGMLRLSVRPLRYTSLSASWSRTDTADGIAYSRAGLTWNQRLTRKAHLSATYERRVRRLSDGSGLHDNRLFAGLHIYLPSRVSLDISQSADGNSSRQRVAASRNLPMQQGYGYRLAIERSGFDGLDDDYRPDLQFMVNGPFGSYSAEYDELAGEPTWRLGMAGSMALVDGSLYASRPLSQSFAVVRTASLDGVRVGFNGLTVGRTRRGGEILVPNLRAYEVNRISIAEEDLPIDYQVEKFERKVVPAPRSGAVVDFGLTRIRAIVGRLVMMEADGEAIALEHLALSIVGMQSALSWRTGIDGEFYLEDIPAGRHLMKGVIGARRFVCPLYVPDEANALIDLGEVSCEEMQ